MAIALMAYAAMNRRMPCPADPALSDSVAGASLERAATATGCTGGQADSVPWATLGLPEVDAWGRRLSYRVSAEYARLPPAFTLASSGDNLVRNSAAVILATATPAVIVSHGTNARASTGPAGTLSAASPDARETENSDGDVEFVADTPDDGFDDLVVWITGPVLAYRMLQAGALP